MNRIGDLKTEWRIAAFVRPNRDAIQKHFAKIVNRAELQQNMPRVLKCRQFKFHPVPGRAHVIAQFIKLRVPRETNAGGAPSRGTFGFFALDAATGIGEELPSKLE